jgi:hypothetical protein
MRWAEFVERFAGVRGIDDLVEDCMTFAVILGVSAWPSNPSIRIEPSLPFGSTEVSRMRARRR